MELPTPTTQPDTATDYEQDHATDARIANIAVQAFDERMNLMEAYARRHGLRGRALSMLLWLYYSADPLTQRDLAARTHATKQVVNMTITGWRKRSLVTTVEAARTAGGTEARHDGRERFLALTDAGRTWAKAILDPLRDAEIKALDAIAPAQRTLFATLQYDYVTALRRHLLDGATTQGAAA